jgi:hypothetical protein
MILSSILVNSTKMFLAIKRHYASHWIGVDMLASFDRRSKDIRILRIIVPELELGDIERHIFRAHLVERANDAALKDRPEALNRVGVNCADDVLPPAVVNGRVRKFLAEMLIAHPLVGTEQADLMRHGFAHKGFKGSGLDVGDDAGDNIALAANCPDDGDFARADAAGSAAPAFVPMAVLFLAADEGFIDFDNATELLDIFHEGSSDLVAHEPSGFQRAEAHISPNLARTHAFLTGQHKVDDAIPIPQWLICVFEDSAYQDGESITVPGTVFALPMPLARGQIVDGEIATSRAANAIRPATGLQIGFAGIIIGEHSFELRDSELNDLHRLGCTGHDLLPTIGEYANA